MILPLAKLKIGVIKKAGETPHKWIEALFNPNTITIQKSTTIATKARSGTKTKVTQPTSRDASTLSMELFFDTYEKGTNVRDKTKDIEKLLVISSDGGRDDHASPICQIIWGQFSDLFIGTLQSLNIRYNLFFANGWPARATLGCTFKEYTNKKKADKADKTNSADVVKTWTVKKGDTLSSISGEVYANSLLWRHIAEANRIDNPCNLKPGISLAIPTLTAKGKI
ncbi:MAG: LysM peptidoglycan-binding domain-containing protein [bacterium]